MIEETSKNRQGIILQKCKQTSNSSKRNKRITRTNLKNNELADRIFNPTSRDTMEVEDLYYSQWNLEYIEGEMF